MIDSATVQIYFSLPVLLHIRFQSLCPFRFQSPGHLVNEKLGECFGISSVENFIPVLGPNGLDRLAVQKAEKVFFGQDFGVGTESK